MEERYRRQAVNEALLRDVNERCAALDRKAGWARSDEAFEFLCECGAGCEARVRMRLEEYERVREQEDRFAVAPGHETDELERVVERHERFLIVDKVDAAEPFVREQRGRARSL